MKTSTKTGHLPPGHRLVATEDGSFTLHSERFDENCHSTSGAREETLIHYLNGCRIEELLQTQQHVRVLEVGFATGLGWAMTRDLAHRYPQARLDFISLELDEALIAWAIPHASKEVRKGLVSFVLQEGNARLRVLSGDARHTLPAFAQHELLRFDAIYQDAFSPKKNPTLWTTEWFTQLGALSHDGTRMSTYSASASVRKAMIAAGWGVAPGEKFGPKKTSTRAVWHQASDPSIIELLSRSPTPALKDQP